MKISVAREDCRPSWIGRINVKMDNWAYAGNNLFAHDDRSCLVTNCTVWSKYYSEVHLYVLLQTIATGWELCNPALWKKIDTDTIEVHRERKPKVLTCSLLIQNSVGNLAWVRPAEMTIAHPLAPLTTVTMSCLTLLPSLAAHMHFRLFGARGTYHSRKLYFPVIALSVLLHQKVGGCQSLAEINDKQLGSCALSPSCAQICFEDTVDFVKCCFFQWATSQKLLARMSQSLGH